MKRKKKLLVNRYEIATNEELKKVASKYEAEVYPKIRIADVVEIENSGISNEEYKYALQAHFDFVITTVKDFDPKFVIEFDEEAHEQDREYIRRDKLKNSICKKFEIPLFRINADFLKEIGNFPKINRRSIFAGNFDSLAGWLVETWFLEKAFYEGQEKGLIPDDEPFCWFSFIGQDPFAQSALYIHKIYKEKLCTTYLPIKIKGHSIDEVAWATLAILPLNNGRYIVGFAECKSVNFSAISAYELCEELALLNIANELFKYQSGKLIGLTKQEIEKNMRFRSFFNKEIKNRNFRTYSKFLCNPLSFVSSWFIFLIHCVSPNFSKPIS
ncbi:DUF2726 domain-containing protein [Anabaena sp. WFMT]|uniref:DUF2726 domain-containing protein n=1 Tax=Anabaena sp. WFMT TaxID=3449730 RepID=UPI003F1EDCB3